MLRTRSPRKEKISNCYLHSNSLSNKMDNSLLDVRDINHKYIVVGRKKKRNSVIGVLHGNKNTLTGIIDVAMVGSMYSRGKFNERINYYGMVIMDECHHAASNTSMELLQKINAKYVYGVSATPKRGDSLDRIIYMLLGPLRHRFTALERAKEQGIGHYFVPRYTRVVDTAESKDNINKAYNFPALQCDIHFLYQKLSRFSFVHKPAFHSIPDYPERLL